MPNVITRRLDSRTRELWNIDKYLWLSLAYALVYIFIAQARNQVLVPLWALWALLVVGTANRVARTYVACRSVRAGAWTHWTKVFTAADVLLIALAIGATGGLHSDLWLLFFVAMLSESLYASARQTAIVAVGIATTYVLSSLPAQLFYHPLDRTTFLTTLGTRLFFLVIVGTYGRIISYTAEEKNRELMLLHEQMATSEERARIAREIHDGLGHALVSIILRLELCIRLLRRAPDEAEAILQDEIPALRAAWNEGRDLAFHLRPWEAEPDPGSLPETLRLHIAQFAERTGQSIRFRSDSACVNLRPTVAYGLKRIVQEALTNAAKHARASNIEVTLQSPAPNQLLCTISDDGQGFNAGLARTGFGLQAMCERAEALGGKLDLKSAPNAGTRIEIILPT